MAKLKNIQRINAQDFPPEYSQLVDGLSGILNDFMQDVIDLSDGRTDYDNLIIKQAQFEITVGDTGTPIQKFQLKTEVSRPSGLQVIRAINTTNPLLPTTGQPFISFESDGAGVVKVNNVTNLISGDKYRLTIIVF